MPKTLRLSVEAIRRAGWLPVSKEAYDKWMNAISCKISTDVRRLPGPGGAAAEGPELLQPVKNFKDFIETNSVVYADFVRMFDGMTESVSIL